MRTRKMTDLDKIEEAWENIKWRSVSVNYKGYKIGGLPDFAKLETLALWPHIQHNDEYIPLKFIAQIYLPDGSKGYVYTETDSADVDVIVKDLLPENGTTAVIVEGRPIPSWITMKELLLEEELLHDSEEAFTAKLNKLPLSPFWVQEPEFALDTEKFVTLIPNNVNDSFINDDLVTYIFLNEKNEPVAFNQSW